MQATVRTNRFLIDRMKAALVAAGLLAVVAAGTAAIVLTDNGAADIAAPQTTLPSQANAETRYLAMGRAEFERWQAGQLDASPVYELELNGLPVAPIAPVDLGLGPVMAAKYERLLADAQVTSDPAPVQVDRADRLEWLSESNIPTDRGPIVSSGSPQHATLSPAQLLAEYARYNTQLDGQSLVTSDPLTTEYEQQNPATP